ncbi:MAG: C45 family peptidase [Polyangia bacterium]|jgi:isopenicillin-N N-acyltransferase-like protein|nr:C45 family peptidase [Polyangia bacterium]
MKTKNAQQGVEGPAVAESRLDTGASFPPRYTSDGRGMLRRDAGVYVLHLQGSDEDMARQHGELLAAEIRQGAIPFMAGYLPGQIHDESFPWPFVWLARQSLELLTRFIGGRLPREHRSSLEAVARGAGLPPHILVQALGVADGLPILMDVMGRIHGLGAAVGALGSAGRGMGCSGVIALPEATRDGHVFHGRNLDYDGFGFWDRFPLVAFCRPLEGQAYAFVSSAGAHTAALTAMNASGLFLGSNTAPTRDVSLRGVPFFVVNENALRKARTLGEAVVLLGDERPVSGYNVHLSHRDGEAAVVEYSYSKSRVRRPKDGLLFATNHYLVPEMAATSPELPIVDLASSAGRLARLEARLGPSRGQITLEQVIDCMRDQVEQAAGETRPAGDVVLNYYNIASVVADVTERRLWVTAEAAPCALGRYVMFDLQGELESFGKERAYPLEEVPGVPESPASMAVGKLLDAHVALAHHHDPKAARACLKEALGAAPEEGRLHLDLALVELNLSNPEPAKWHAQRFLELALPSEPRRHRGHLVLAWCNDLAGQRAEAVEERARARAAARGSRSAEFELSVFGRKRMTPGDCKGMQIDLYNGRRLA